MKLYLLTQNENTGYDTYGSCVVCAENENEAKKIHPSDSLHWRDEKRKCIDENGKFFSNSGVSDWVMPDKVKIKYLGEAAPNIEKGVVIACYNTE